MNSEACKATAGVQEYNMELAKSIINPISLLGKFVKLFSLDYWITLKLKKTQEKRKMLQKAQIIQLKLNKIQ